MKWKTNRKSYVAYQMAAKAESLNDLEGHSQVAGLFKCNPSNTCAAFYTTSTDSVLADPLRLLSFLYESGDLSYTEN